MVFLGLKVVETTLIEGRYIENSTYYEFFQTFI